MLFENKDLKTTFEVPDRLTLRQLLRYDGTVEMMPDATIYERLWPGACVLIEKWQSEALPEAKPEALDGEVNALAYDVIKWVSLTVFSFVRKVKDVPKN